MRARGWKSPGPLASMKPKLLRDPTQKSDVYDFLRAHLQQIKETLDSVRRSRRWSEDSAEDCRFLGTRAFCLLVDRLYPEPWHPTPEDVRRELLRGLPLPPPPQTHFDALRFERLSSRRRGKVSTPKRKELHGTLSVPRASNSAPVGSAEERKAARPVRRVHGLRKNFHGARTDSPFQRLLCGAVPEGDFGTVAELREHRRSHPEVHPKPGEAAYRKPAAHPAEGDRSQLELDWTRGWGRPYPG